MNLKKNFRTYDDVKVTQKQSFVLSSGSVFFELYSLGKVWVFLNELVFCQIIAIFRFI